MNNERASDQTKSAEASGEGRGAKLGGARAEFVASLGKKLKDARDVLGELSGKAEKSGKSEKGGKPEKSADKPRVTKDDLRRRLHAIGASAKLLRFDAMAQALAEAAEVLDRTPGSLTINDVGAIASVLDDLPAMAWGEPSIREEIQRKPASDPPPAIVEALRRTALVVGEAMLAEALMDADIAAPFDCARTSDVQEAMSIARSDPPDVVVIDESVEDAPDLVEALLDDATTEGVPVIVVGGKQAARFVALGVARTLPKPITAENLRRACDEAIEQKNEVTMRVTLGEPTLEQLGERLAEEVRRALIESAGTARGTRIPLGEGTEVMSAMWGAIARVREVVTARTGGAVRFGANGPEGAIAVAPWLHPDSSASDRVPGATDRGRGAAIDVRLHGRHVVVADDDPGVTWFISDLLRTAGCVVHEALDGNAALDLCFRTSPDVVISDILMPGLDGFALTRALKRDVALRDVPVILLSWKEDLLQRVRELGASAAAYLRKESDSRAIVARVRECLRPRARVEARLRAEGEVRGRLDGLTPRLLLELACALRPDSRVSIRDASFLYEVEIRDGAPRRATRSRSEAATESFARGELVMASLLGVGAGRFTIASSTTPIAPADRDFSGSLAQQLAKPLAIARAARRVTTGAATITVEKIRLDRDAVDALTGSTPEPARSLVLALTDGASPRQLLLGSKVDPALLDDVLGDLAARGAIEAVWVKGGEEVLADAVHAHGGAPKTGAAPAPARPARSPVPPAPVAAPAARVTASALVAATAPVATPARAAAKDDDDDLVASSLTDAVMREISDRAPEIRTRSSNPPPIVEPSALKPRSSNPPADEVSAAILNTPIPHDAIVPAEADDRTDVDAAVEARHVAEQAEERSVSIPIDVSTGLSAPIARKAEPKVEADLEAPGRTPLSSVSARLPPDREEAPPPPVRWTWLVGLGAVATAAAVVLQISNAPPNPAAAAGVAPTPTASAETANATPQNVSYVDIPSGVNVTAGQGVIEVHTRGGLAVRIDGLGHGDMPAIRVPVEAGSHEVQIAARGENDAAVVRQVEVRAGKSTRIDLPAL